MNLNIYNPYVREEFELYHHGIAGMRWGKRNGPPYPLSAGAHSASEKKAGWRKSLDKDGRMEKVKKQSTLGAISGTARLNSLDQRKAEWNRTLMYRQRAVEGAKNRYNKKLAKYGSESRKTEKALNRVQRRERDAQRIVSRMDKMEAKTQKTLARLKASGYTINSRQVTRYAADGSGYIGYALGSTHGGVTGGLIGSMAMTALDYKFGYGAQQKGVQYKVRKNIKR